MGTCDVCGSYAETGKVQLRDEATGRSRTANMCPECAVKGALIVKSLGGRVEVGSRRSAGSGWGKAIFILAAIGAVIYFLAR